MTITYKKVKIIYSDWKVRQPQIFEGYIIDVGPFYLHVSNKLDGMDPEKKDTIILSRDIRGIEYVEEKEEPEASEGDQGRDRVIPEEKTTD